MTSSPLYERLRRLIAANGPISVADYMSSCLSDPEHGYYTTRRVFGAGGDFITAPEVSQIFGEIVGAWLAEAWRLAGKPEPVALVELGPGRGTLMADILRVAALVPRLRQALRVHLVETSPALRERQRAALAGSDADATWHTSLDGVPAGPLLLVANEFFDALPVRQFVRAEDGWRERVVGLDADGELAFGIGPGQLDAALPAEEGVILEIRPAGEAIMAEIAGRIARDGGAALIIDYGHSTTACGDTLQAVRGHAFADPLHHPGEADLTAHVDFAALVRAAEAAGAAAHGPMPQGAFLQALGIAQRAERLAASADEDSRTSILTALERLTAPEAMGTLFKVLAITQPDLYPPPSRLRFDFT